MCNCVLIQVLRTHIIAVFMVWSRVCVCGRCCLLARWAQICFFFKAREPENIQITQSNSDKLVCLQRAVMFVRRYVNLAGSPLATDSWVKREDTDWRSEAKICHSDTNHGDLKRSGMLAERRDSEWSIVTDWPRGTRGVQWHPSISWSRSLGTTNCLGTPVFYGSASVSVSPPFIVTGYGY